MYEVLLSLEIAGACAVALVVVLVLVVLRRRRLLARLGTFDCSIRQARGARRRWALGVAQYERDRLDWYRTFSLSPRPSCTYARRALAVTVFRDAEGLELAAVQPGAMIVECRLETGAVAGQGEEIEFAMGRDAYTGFASWLESAPPGQGVNVA
ncbi:DUF2550 domain-containing protein [Kineococcus sp. LSe6-4]|uniref:DUF2550 domain-containing protein n=1 Tax=Kineococcus halophytocola TaxID=3234027 RepID=A0ABV4H419_9ACTN